MKNHIREYDTIKFFRGRKRKIIEMQRLAEEHLDFEYRRLLIEENELDLHVAFSKMIVWNRMSWIILILSLIFIKVLIAFYCLIAISLIFQILSYRSKKHFQFVFRGYNLALLFIDSIIKSDYGITMPKI